MTSPPDPSAVRCPTCRAEQAWSDTCRRCRSDLRLLRDAASTYWRARRDCLASLRSKRVAPALQSARLCHRLCPSPESLRLLASCSLLLGDWPSAASLGQLALAGEEG